MSLKHTVDRSLVPNRDFVLYVRDTAISQPSAISTQIPSGSQAISIRMLPDCRSEQIKARVQSELRDVASLDMSANITYGKNEAEKQAMQDDALSENDVSDSDEEMKE